MWPLWCNASPLIFIYLCARPASGWEDTCFSMGSLPQNRIIQQTSFSQVKTIFFMFFMLCWKKLECFNVWYRVWYYIIESARICQTISHDNWAYYGKQNVQVKELIFREAFQDLACTVIPQEVALTIKLQGALSRIELRGTIPKL